MAPSSHAPVSKPLPDFGERLKLFWRIRRWGPLSAWSNSLSHAHAEGDFSLVWWLEKRGVSAKGLSLLSYEFILNLADDKPLAALLRCGLDANTQERNNQGNFLIHKAARRLMPGKVALLLQHGADPNALNYNGYSPLYMATSSMPWPSGLQNAKSEVTQARLVGCVDALLSAGATVDLPLWRGRLTALREARWNVEVMERLLQHTQTFATQATPEPHYEAVGPMEQAHVVFRWPESTTVAHARDFLALFQKSGAMDALTTDQRQLLPLYVLDNAYAPEIPTELWADLLTQAGMGFETVPTLANGDTVFHHWARITGNEPSRGREWMDTLLAIPALEGCQRARNHDGLTPMDLLEQGIPKMPTRDARQCLNQVKAAWKAHLLAQTLEALPDHQLAPSAPRVRL